MKNIGITGQSGFIGTHLYNTLSLYKEKYRLIEFSDDFFDDTAALNNFVSQCDVIVHLAAVNRHENSDVLVNTNILLVEKLIQSVERHRGLRRIVFSSSIQEEKNNEYGKSKRIGREKFIESAKKCNYGFSGLLIPNVFGPFGRPFYNSVVATFCHQLVRNNTPVIDVDAELKLIYVSELIDEMITHIDMESTAVVDTVVVPHTGEIKVSAVLKKLIAYKEDYLLKGKIPDLKNSLDVNLFNTFRSFIDLQRHFPSVYDMHTDARGSFVEIMREETGGQVSFSTTVPGVTRGNHFHTRKIERFAVIKGEAKIRMRKIGTGDILEFSLSGSRPSYVDMPIWYTHNITNVGTDDLYTIFWINEFFNPDDPDTYFENV